MTRVTGDPPEATELPPAPRKVLGNHIPCPACSSKEPELLPRGADSSAGNPAVPKAVVPHVACSVTVKTLAPEGTLPLVSATSTSTIPGPSWPPELHSTACRHQPPLLPGSTLLSRGHRGLHCQPLVSITPLKQFLLRCPGSSLPLSPTHPRSFCHSNT